MKKLIAILLAGFIVNTACSKTDSVTALKGDIGNPGAPGQNGHSLSVMINEVTGCECDNAGGTRVDFFLDLDDSLSANEGDQFLVGYVTCNGKNGRRGPQGPQGVEGPAGPQGEPGATGEQGPVGLTGPQGEPGPSGSGATVTSKTSSSCTALALGYYGKSSSNHYDVYTSSSCHSHTKVFSLDDSSPILWVSDDVKFEFASPNDARVIEFN